MVFYDKLKSKMSENPFSKEVIKVMNENGGSILIGFTKIILDDDVLKIQHSGRYDHNIDNVNWNLSDVNLPFIENLRDTFPVLLEQGHPDFFYVLQIQV